MYIDKPMKGHNLMQAIAQINRVYFEKQGGLIVDYLGVAQELKNALSMQKAQNPDNPRKQTLPCTAGCIPPVQGHSLGRIVGQMMGNLCLKYAISRFKLLMSGTFAQLTAEYAALSRSDRQISCLSFVSGMLLVCA
jgi:hypothetical protein